tara:strand:- start:3220 stop:3540 length:321 start_codon:yes stop_codon:yes gene_type:complete
MTDKISALQEKLASNPGQVFHRYSLAQAYYENKQLHEACDEFEKCLEAKPDWMMAALFLGKAYLENENREKAKVYLEQAMSLAEDQNHDDPAEEATKLLTECSRPG